MPQTLLGPLEMIVCRSCDVNNVDVGTLDDILIGSIRLVNAVECRKFFGLGFASCRYSGSDCSVGYGDCLDVVGGYAAGREDSPFDWVVGEGGNEASSDHCCNNNNNKEQNGRKRRVISRWSLVVLSH